MMGSIKAAELYINKIVVRNMFNKLIDIKAGTEEVEATAKRVVGVKNLRRLEKEVVRIMGIRKRQIEKEARILKHDWFKKNSDLRKYIDIPQVRRDYLRIEVKHRQFLYKTKLIACKDKVMYIKQKRGNRLRSQTTQKHYWYKITDQELQTEKRTDFGNNFEVYGDVELDDTERSCLALGPKFMMTPKLDKEDFEVEAELECVKQRMELWKRSELADENGYVDEMDVVHADITYRNSKTIFDAKKCKLDMSKMAVTDSKYNIRSFPIRAAKVPDEILIQMKKREMLTTFSNTARHTNDKMGNHQKKDNISKEEKVGLRKLNKRVQSGEVVITTTDKSGKFAVVETQLYKEAARIHLNDEEITPERMTETETLLNRYALQIVKALQMGTRHGKTIEKQEERMRQAFMSKGGRPGPVYFLIKDHNSIVEGSSIPPTRPVCNARGGPGARLSNLLSTILNKATDSMKSTTECMSTEEALRNMLDCNRRLRNGEFGPGAQDAIIMSMDVKSLYPSMRKTEVRQIVGEVI